MILKDPFENRRRSSRIPMKKVQKILEDPCNNIREDPCEGSRDGRQPRRILILVEIISPRIMAKLVKKNQ
jgi:hypothetical protein